MLQLIYSLKATSLVSSDICVSLTGEKDPEILALLHLRTSPPNQRGQAALSRWPSVPSVLEVVIVVPAASHSAPVCAEGPGWIKPTPLSAKSRDETLWFPAWTPPGPWLHMQILPVKIMNRIGDPGVALLESNMQRKQARRPSSCSVQPLTQGPGPRAPDPGLRTRGTPPLDTTRHRVQSTTHTPSGLNCLSNTIGIFLHSLEPQRPASNVR